MGGIRNGTDGWFEALRAEVHRSIQPAVAMVRGHIAFTVECCDCGPQPVEFDKKLPTQVVRNKLRQRGWCLDRKARCPTHKEKPQMAKPELHASASATTIAAQDVSDEARVARRLATMLIEEKFDPAKGNYRDGYSDAKIAEETGAAPAFVAKRREEDYGPLKEPEAFAEFRGKIDALAQRIDQFARDTDHLKVAAANTGEQLQSGLRDLRSELDRIARRNGWTQ